MALTTQLNTLEVSGLIRLAQVEPELEYLFRHTLVQEAAYTSLLPADQKRLHFEVGEALEHAYPDRLESRELAPVLGRHFAQAGDDERALRYLTTAADLALASYANQEAEGHYRLALTLARTDEPRVRLMVGLGRVLARQGHYVEAVEVSREAIRLSQALGDADRAAWLYARIGRALWQKGDIPGSLAACEEGLAAVDQAAETPGLAALLHEAGRAYHFNGQPDQAAPLVRRALDLAGRLGAIDVEADSLTTLSIIPNQPGDQVLVWLARAIELAEPAGLLRIAVRAHHNLANARLTLQGDLDGARREYLRAAELARLRGSASEELFSMSSAIALALNTGKMVEAEAPLPELYQLARTLPDAGTALTNLDSLRAMSLSQRGEWRQAALLLSECQQRSRASGNLDLLAGLNIGLTNNLLEMVEWEGVDRWQEIEDSLREAIDIGDRGVTSAVQPRCVLARVRIKQGRLDDARALLAQAEACAAASGTAWEQLILAAANGFLAGGEGRWSDAIAAAEQGISFLAGLGLRWDQARSTIDLAAAHAARGEPGDPERARALLREAREMFEQMGAPRYAQIVDDRLDSLAAALYDEVLAGHKVSQELAAAARVQSSFLPEALPQLPGWQLAARWEPARQTSGDFYDVILLPNGRLGLLIADVSDKGAGAALYMAMSRTVIRTYALEHATQPEVALAAANHRILADGHAMPSMFLTAFYGVLDPADGTLLYCNAGHNPPYVFRPGDPHPPRALARTGLPVGILEGAWEQGSARLQPGDVLLLYTDGITDAQDTQGAMFGEEPLLAAAQAALGCSAQDIQDALLAAVHAFVAGAPRADDITIMVLKREGL